MKASQKEAECRWYEAAKSYEEEAICKPQASSSNAASWEKAGSCYDRASRQATNAEEFRRQRQLGVEAYEKAAQIYKNLLKNQGKNLECLANAELMRSWLAPNATEKSKTLRRSCILGKNALKVYKRDGDELNYGRTCNTLALCMYDLQNMIPMLEGKRKALEEGFDIAADGVSVLSRLKRVHDLVFSLSLSSLLGTSLSEVSDGETGISLGKTCLEYSKKAVLLSEQIDEPYSKSISRWAQITSIIFFGEEIEKKHFREYSEEMLQQSLKVGDNYLTGIAYNLIAGTLYVTINEEPDLGKKRQTLEDIVKYSENAANHLQLFNQNADIATAYYFNTDSNSVIARISAITPSEKLDYLKKAIVAGEKGLDYAKISGSPSALEGSTHALSRAYYFSSIIESRKEKKMELLEKALRYRKEEIRSTRTAFASNSWYIGMGMVCAAQIEAELARLERDKENRLASFKNAVVHMESGITECKKELEVRPLSHIIENVARFEDEFGGMLEESYLSTKEQEDLKKANDVYVDAAENFKKIEMPSRVAETCWKIARNLDLVGEYSHAAENFERGFAWYKAAAQKISQFGDFYLDYASYMKAWSEIETAKLEHCNEKYTDAMNHYEKASILLKQSKSWNYLSPNFRAWSLLEQAEDLSRKDNCKESIVAFEKAIKFLRDSEQVLRTELGRIDKTDEQNLVKRLIQASNIRVEYSNGRIVIEEAKILDRQGDYEASSQKYESAAETFKKILKIDPEQTGKEVRPLIFLCQAWQKMTLAEARSSPIMYEEAADLFTLANEHSTKESTSLLALGHSSFCKALEAGTEFEVTRNTNMYEETAKHMNSAVNYYLRAGFQSASDYAKATQRLFDAYVYMDSAKREKDPEKEAKYYLMAEKVLQISAEYFARSGRIEKSEQVQRLLWRVRDEKEARALSTPQLLHHRRRVFQQ